MCHFEQRDEEEPGRRLQGNRQRGSKACGISVVACGQRSTGEELPVRDLLQIAPCQLHGPSLHLGPGSDWEGVAIIDVSQRTHSWLLAQLVSNRSDSGSTADQGGRERNRMSHVPPVWEQRALGDKHQAADWPFTR